MVSIGKIEQGVAAYLDSELMGFRELLQVQQCLF